jgi:hypothetical protein
MSCIKGNRVAMRRCTYTSSKVRAPLRLEWVEDGTCDWNTLIRSGDYIEDLEPIAIACVSV